jgi:hypothetical protein
MPYSRSSHRRAGSKGAAKWHIGSVLTGLDGYARKVPTFNIHGDTEVKTAVGGVLTCAIILLVLGYGAIKAIQLAGRQNPKVNTFKVANNYPGREMIDLNEIKFRAAFSVENYWDRRMIDDPRYVKTLMRLIGTRGGERYEKILPHHKCTEADYAEFYPAHTNSEDQLKAMQSDENRGLYCVDEWDDDMFAGGEEEASEYQRLDFAVVPCNYIHYEFGDVGDTISEDCIADLDAQIAYMGPIQMILYLNM